MQTYYLVSILMARSCSWSDLAALFLSWSCVSGGKGVVS